MKCPGPGCEGHLKADEKKAPSGFKHMLCLSCKRGWLAIEKYINDSICKEKHDSINTLQKDYNETEREV